MACLTRPLRSLRLSYLSKDVRLCSGESLERNTVKLGRILIHAQNLTYGSTRHDNMSINWPTLRVACQ